MSKAAARLGAQVAPRRWRRTSVGTSIERVPHRLSTCVDTYEENTYGAKWEIDEKALLDYLLSLGPTADHALHDVMVRWWDGSQEHSIEGWANVGLRVTKTHPEEA